MSPEKQRIAIAEVCGWKLEERFESSFKDPSKQISRGKQWKHPNGLFVVVCPDYLSDLNAMHEAEKTLTVLKREYYAQQLFELLDVPITCFNSNHIKMWVLLRATASQRAEAFLRTLNLWQDDET